MKDKEHDLHIWAKPETENMAALFTVSHGKNAICIDMPLDKAVEYIINHIEEMVAE